MSIADLSGEDLEGLVGRELDGRYLLDQFIDRGGFGAVYRGIDKKFNRPVAVKVGLSYREFMKEAKLASEVRHDNIVQVSDYGNDKGLAYLVMEFLYGDDLEQLFKKQGCKLTEEQMLMFVSQVGDALVHAHSLNLIHRDLKPRNIILKQNPTRADTKPANARFVLLDFGIAAKLDASGTQRNRTQDGAGTIEYMAPELLRTKPLTTPQTDIYAFGTLLYQLLTGSVPFPQTDTSHIALAQIVHAISNLPPPRFSVVAPDRKFPAGVEELVMQCLEKDPSRRPQMLSEVRDRFLIAYASPPPVPPTKKRRPDYSKTILPGDVDVEQQDEVEQTVRSTPPQKQSSSGSWLFVLFVSIIAVAVVIGQRYYQPAARPVPILLSAQDNNPTPIVDGGPVSLEAGGFATLSFTIEGVPTGTEVQFQPPEVQEGVHVQLQPGPVPGRSKTLLISVPDVDSPLHSVPKITFRAIVPNQKDPVERSISLVIHRPQPWMPDALRSLGFREAADSRLCRVGPEVFASILERSVAGQSVRFRLVPAAEIGDRRIKTFYAMEQLVTNSLFNEFAKAVPDFQVEQRSDSDRSWSTADQFPVTNIEVLEALHFANWLAGRFGSLPTTTEWEVFGGYYDFLRVLESKFDKPPTEIYSDDLDSFQFNETNPYLNSKVWIGAGPTLNELHEPNGSVLKGCSPYGCRYDRLSDGSRPTEMTSSLNDYRLVESEVLTSPLFRQGIPNKNDPQLRERDFAARLRGLDKRDPHEEVRWVKTDGKELRIREVEDFNNDSGVLKLTGNGVRADSYISFRVVLTTDLDRK